MRKNPEKTSVVVSETGNVTPPAALESRRNVFLTGVGAAILALGAVLPAIAQLPLVPPSVVDPNLAVRKVAFGLSQPTSMAFIGTNDILVLEKASEQDVFARSRVPMRPDAKDHGEDPYVVDPRGDEPST